MRGCVLLAALLALCGPVLGTHVGVVMFRARGISGYIRFTEINETSTQIVANLQGLPGNSHNWHVHTLPIDQTRDPAVQCLSVWAGPHYDPFNARAAANYSQQCTPDTPLGCEAGDLAGKFGPLDSTGQIDVIDTTGELVLDGRYSIIGRSVVIHAVDGTNFECGTIRSAEDNMMGATVLQATFISPVAGTIYFRQAPGDAVHMWGKLYWVNDSPSTMNHNWHIHERAPADDTYRIGMCSSVGPHYDPTGNGPTSAMGYNVTCTPDTPEQCEIGDLTGKHDTIDISATPANYATDSFFFTDVFLNLTGVFAVEGRSVVIHAANRAGPMIACAPLVASETISLSTYLYNYISASQQSPFDDTVFTRNSDPSSSYSILNSALSPNDICPVDSSEAFGSTYSPYTVGNYMNTPDRFPLGDLQNRYSMNLVNGGSFRVFDMPVYGPNVTISGLALRADLGANSRRQCGALIPDLSGGEVPVFAAKASFSGAVNGNIIFIQRYNADGVLGNTSTHVYVDIYYAAETNQTTGHNWHVHMNPPQPSMTCTAAIGGHYNPFSVSLANMDSSQPSSNSNYRDDCSPLYPLRCESGDLSNKHGQLSIASAVAGRPTYTYVDNNLYLFGNYSIVGRSIGLHRPSSEGGALFDCAQIRRFYVSTSFLRVVFVEGQYDRIGLMRRLTDGTNVDPNDVLVLAQEVMPTIVDGNTFMCANVTMRVLGGTQTEANDNYDVLAPIAQDSAVFRCSGPLTVAPLSLLLLAACLLLALAY